MLNDFHQRISSFYERVSSYVVVDKELLCCHAALLKACEQWALNTSQLEEVPYVNRVVKCRFLVL